MRFRQRPFGKLEVVLKLHKNLFGKLEAQLQLLEVAHPAPQKAFGGF